MKIEVYGWEKGMKKLPFGDFLKQYAGIEKASSAIYGLFEKDPKVISIDVAQDDLEDVKEKLSDFGVKYKILD